MKNHLLTNSKSEGGSITKLNSNAFTLIELLAIIVILAIIAVITVPIILNIIENSREGASVDSAYGYKDSVQQYYLSQSVGSTTNEVLTIDTVKTVSQLESDGLTVSGDKPSDGWVQLNKGQVVDYSLKFGDYVVSFDTTTNTATATKNGDLKAQPTNELTMDYMCPNCVYRFLAYDPSGASYPDIGDGLSEDDYVEDYNDLEDAVTGEEVVVFVGFKLDENSKIEKAFACGIEKNKPFCIEGYNTGSSISTKNIDILTSIFGDTYDSEADRGCEITGNGIYCGGDAVTVWAGNDGFAYTADNYGNYMYIETNGYIWNNAG